MKRFKGYMRHFSIAATFSNKDYLEEEDAMFGGKRVRLNPPPPPAAE